MEPLAAGHTGDGIVALVGGVVVIWPDCVVVVGALSNCVMMTGALLGCVVVTVLVLEPALDAPLDRAKY